MPTCCSSVACLPVYLSLISRTSAFTPLTDPRTRRTQEQGSTPHPALEGVREGEEAGGGGLRPGERGEGKESGKETPPTGTPPTTPSPVEAARGPHSPGNSSETPPGDSSPGIISRRTPVNGNLTTRRNHLPGTQTSPGKPSGNTALPEIPGKTSSSPERLRPTLKKQTSLVRNTSLPDIKTIPEEPPDKSDSPVENPPSPGFTTSRVQLETGLTPVRNISSPETKTLAESPARTKRSPERKPRVTFSPDTKAPEDTPDPPVKIKTFSELTDALGIITSPLGLATSKSARLLEIPVEMDVELPVPEQLACLYDVVKAVKNSNENLSPQEIETKFTQLSLAFKTDRLTLRQRLDLQQRHRDTAENNHEEDMDCLRRLVLEIQADCMDNELADSISQVRRHLDVLTASSTRLVSTSEVWGAVQQEWRLARAVEVIFRHVEDVKRKYEGVKQELEELKRLLTEYQIELPVSNASGGSAGGGSNNQGGTDSPSTSRRLRALSLAVCSNKAGTEKESRRTSIAASKSSSSGLSMARSRGRRASLMPDLKPFREQQLAAFAAVANAASAANAAAKDSSSSSSSSSGSSLGALKERVEEASGSNTAPSGRLHSCITEEVSESGEEEGGGSTQESDATSTATNPSSGSYSNLSPLSPATLSHLQALAERGHGMDDSDDGESDDQSQSDMSQGSSEYREPPTPSFTTSLWNRLGSEHWLLEAFKEVLAWAKGGQWPYSQQQTVLGARYAFTSILLVAAALFLLVTLSSGNASVPEPRHPGWTTVRHILHPFVAMRYLEPPPT